MERTGIAVRKKMSGLCTVEDLCIHERIQMNIVQVGFVTGLDDGSFPSMAHEHFIAAFTIHCFGN